MVASALASVLLRSALYAVGAFCGTMLLVAILYLTIASPLVFAVQLVLYTAISAALLLAVLRQTTGIDGAAPVGPFSREWIIGGGVAAAFLALLGLVMALTKWPVSTCCALSTGVFDTLSDSYVVAIWTLAILVGSAALACGLLLTSTTLASFRSEPRRSGRPPRSRP